VHYAYNCKQMMDCVVQDWCGQGGNAEKRFECCMCRGTANANYHFGVLLNCLLNICGTNFGCWGGAAGQQCKNQYNNCKAN